MKLEKLNFPKWPSYSNEEIEAATKILKSGNVNYRDGIISKKFEKNFANYLNVKYAVGLFNGSIALEVALRSININKNDEVIVTPKSFIISSSIPILVNAKPVFADIDNSTLGLTLKSIKKVVTKKTKAIIAVHLGGMPCDIINISKYAKKNNIYLIEDCSQSHGGEYFNKKLGTFGDLATFSFCKDKIISTGGEGGMVVTNSKKLYTRIAEYKDHGKVYKNQNIFKNNYQYIHNSFGTNYRITEFQSALGIIQLKNLEKNIKIRNKISKKIYNVSKKYKDFIELPLHNKNIRNAFYDCYLIIKTENLKKKYNIKNLIINLRRVGINCTIGSCPELYKEKVFKKYLPKNFFLYNAKNLRDKTLCLKINHKFGSIFIDKYINNFEYVLKKFINE